MRLVFVLALALCLAARGITFKPQQPLQDLKEVSGSDFRASQNAWNDPPLSFNEIETTASVGVKPKKHYRQRQPNALEPLSFTEIETTAGVKPKKHHKRNRQRKDSFDYRYDEALKVDMKMYGGKTYTPKPGDENYFDFVAFNEYAKAVHRENLRKDSHHHHYKRYVSNTTTGAIVSGLALSACIQISVCASDVATAGATTAVASPGPDICGKFGFSGSLTLETTQTAPKKQVLKISASIGAAMVAKLTSKFSVNIYLKGTAEWEFNIDISGNNAEFDSVYKALFGACQSLIADYQNRKSVSTKLAGRIESTRKEMAADPEDAIPNPADAPPQTNELLSLTLVHYKILADYQSRLAQLTTFNLATVKNAIAISAVSVIWDAQKSDMTSWPNKLPLKWFNDYGSFSTRFRCSNLAKTDKWTTGLTGINRETKVDGYSIGLPWAHVLYCSLLKYGTYLENYTDTGYTASKLTDFPTMRTKAKSSDENVMNSIWKLYKEIIPGSATELQAIQNQLADWLAAYQLVTNWTATQSIQTTYVNSTQQPSSYTVLIPAENIIAVKDKDPCSTARQLFQYLAVPQTDLVTYLASQGFQEVPAGRFTFTQVTLAGNVGISLGNELSFCGDVNWAFTLDYGRKWTYVRPNPSAGEAGGWNPSTSETTITFFLSEYFKLQVVIPPTPSAATPVKTIFTIQLGEFDQKVGLDDGKAFTIIKQITDVYVAFKALLNATTATQKKDAVMGIGKAIFSQEVIQKILKALGLTPVTLPDGPLKTLVGRISTLASSAINAGKAAAKAALDAAGVTFEYKQNQYEIEFELQWFKNQTGGISWPSVRFNLGIGKSVSGGVGKVSAEIASKELLSYTSTSYVQ